MDNVFLYVLIGFLAIVVLSSFVTVQQGTVGVTTIFGKYNRILFPGLNFKIPLTRSLLSKRYSNAFPSRTVPWSWNSRPLP